MAQEPTVQEILGAYQLGLISIPEARKALGFNETEGKQ